MAQNKSKSNTGFYYVKNPNFKEMRVCDEMLICFKIGLLEHLTFYGFGKTLFECLGQRSGKFYFTTFP